MHECWLRTNRRALALGLIIPLIIAAIGFGMALGIHGEGLVAYLRWLGWAFVVIGCFVAGVLIQLIRTPRLAYHDGYLCVYVNEITPIEVPIDIVECFFLGQDTGTMKAPVGVTPDVATIVVRLAERATDWHHRDVRRALGRWCDGYIVINGSWCEPIGRDLLGRMNKRLVEVHRETRATGKTEIS